MEPRKEGKAKPEEHREEIYKGVHLQKWYKSRCRQIQRKTPTSQIPEGSSNIPNELKLQGDLWWLDRSQRSSGPWSWFLGTKRNHFPCLWQTGHMATCAATCGAYWHTKVHAGITITCYTSQSPCWHPSPFSPRPYHPTVLLLMVFPFHPATPSPWNPVIFAVFFMLSDPASLTMFFLFSIPCSSPLSCR